MKKPDDTLNDVSCIKDRINKNVILNEENIKIDSTNSKSDSQTSLKSHNTLLKDNNSNINNIVYTRKIICSKSINAKSYNK
jgi:hypothetical protein